MQTLIRPLSWLLVSLALVACGSAVTITGRWRDPKKLQHFDRILVVGMAPRDVVRHMYEDEFTQRLRDNGIDAKQSYEVLGEGEPAPEQIQQALADKGLGFDAALTTHLLNVENRRERHRGQTTATPVAGVGAGFYASPYYAPYYGPGFGPYYTAVYSYTREPDYYTTSKVYNLETTLHASADGSLVWAVISEAVDPEGLSETIDGLADAILGAMKEDGVL